MKSKHLLIMMLLAVFAPWAANAQESIPYTEGFESMSSADDLTTAGWISYNSQSGSVLKIETSASNVHSGSKALNMDSWDASSNAAILVAGLPVVDAAINTLQITFSYKVSTGTVDVGYLTDVNDASTFVSLAAFNNSSSYSTKTVMLNEAPASAARIAIKYTNYYRCYVDDITVETIPTCFAPQNLTCTEYTATSATLTWQRHASGTENAWVLQYSTDNTFATGVQSVNVSNTPSTQLTDLTAETKYYARVRPDCDENLWSDVCEFKPTAAQTVTIGSGTGTTSYFPSNPNYDYSYTQQIYTAAEIGQMGAIKSVSFKGNKAGTRTFVVYMANTTKETFADKTDVIPIADATQVFSGSVTFTANEWKTIELAGDGFDYDGGNLAIIVDDNSGNWTMGSTNWAAFSTSGNQALYFYRDSNDIDPSSPASSSNSVSTSKNQIILSILPSATPKPRNIQVSDITASQATVSWEAPATGTPTGYEYQIKVSGEEWPTSWTSAENNLSVEPTGLSASTDYVVRVRAIYAEGESGSIETEFRTLDACAFPTNFTATTVPGVGTDANFSWVKGYDETAWNLQLATDVDFNNVVTTYFTDDGFVVDGNNVTFHATGLTPEQTYYARVQADCGSGSTSVWSNVETFTPSNYVDFTFKENATSSTSYTPFYGSSTTNATNQSQCVIPASELVDLTGGTIRRITYYTSSTATTTWGGVTFNVYMAEVDNTEFPSTSPTFYDWTSLTNVYTGTVSLSNGMMAIDFDNNFTYNGGNLLIGFKTNTVGTATQSVSWTANYESTYHELHQYGTNNAARSRYLPKITFNYQPTPYKYPVIDEASCTAGTTTAHIAWTVTGATPTGYQYQYKSASATDWPSAWTSVTTAYADLSDLTPGSFYDFRVKALYDGGNESVVVDYSFVTECAAITAFPWSEKFEAYSAGDFSHPCWVNEHISGNGTYIFKVYTSTTSSNTTHQLQLPDQTEGTLTKLRLPEMNLPSNDYQFVIDVYRNNSTYNENYPYEGIRVFASTDGNIEGATELTFIPRQYNVSSTLIPEESEVGWYTYEIPIGVSGTCYIILRGESQYCNSTYMDNLTVEQIPTCARPSELASSNVTNHSATIEWTAGDAEQTLWQIAYSKTNFDPNTANFDVTTVTTIDATAHPFTLDKILDPESTYYVYVRTNCGTAVEPDFGPWSRKGINFTTQVATPAPSNFVATNPASEKVDMTWNAGGGDFESWELYYVASETAPEAPTATTQASVSDITTLPTTEAPYVLEGLNPVTKYYAWIRAKHVWNNETTYSDWVALTGNYFETLDACPTPTNLVATNLTSVSADLSWVGSDDVTEGYTVEYGEEGTYSLNETVDFSGLTPVNYNATGGELPEGWYSYNTSTSGFAPRVSSSSNYSYISGLTGNFLLMTTNAYNATDPSANQYAYAIMPQYSNLGSVSFDYQYENISYGTLTVGYVTNNEGYTTYQVLETPTKAAGKQTWSLTATHIATINNANGYVAFRYESGNGTYYSVGIDNVTIKGGTYTPSATQTVQAEGTSITITSLTPNKTYIVKVKSNCINGEWSNMASFTTLAEGNMVFTNATNDGKWGTAGNWVPAQLPVITDEVILRANATIESGCEAQANKINLNSNNLTIADGGQLITNTAVTATVRKDIKAVENWSGASEDWYFIAHPIATSSFNPSNAGLITDNLGEEATNATATYDLYQLGVNEVEPEWKNYRNNSFSLSNGNGYLYASKNGVTLEFTGTVNVNTTKNVNVRKGFSLVGNPFTYNAYLNVPYYVMGPNGTLNAQVQNSGVIAPCTGVVVEADAEGSVTFSKDEPNAGGAKGGVNIALAEANSRGGVIDNAIVSFNNSKLGKFYFGNHSANIYIPQDGLDYAIVSAEAQGETPVNFKAAKNGTFTLSFNAENVEMNYLHLIDNKTGNDIDLLATPSYTFDARTTDYASRFKLVYSTGNASDDDFAFISNGEIILNGINGNTNVQLFDVTGRMISSTNGANRISIESMASGVYMIRLVNGNNVKTQKIVIK